MTRKHMQSGVSEAIMQLREIRDGNTAIYGVNISVLAFKSVLQDQCLLSHPSVVGRFTEEGLLAVQVACEQALVYILSKATDAWRARSEESLFQEFPFITGDDVKSAYHNASIVMQNRLTVIEKS